MKTKILIIVLFAILFAVPLILRRPAEKIDTTADQLVIITANSESIRYETEQAFRKYYEERTGRKVSIDWRTLGGTSEITRYLNSTFIANFQHEWATVQGHDWNEEIAVNFLSPKIKEGDAAWAARQGFLNSDVGVGIDLFFGGGQYDHNKCARAGMFVPAGVRERHPEWFEGETPVLTEGMGGEIWYDRDDCYYGGCFSAFGICYNRDRLADCGFAVDDGEVVTTWRDLADPRLFGAVGLADPSKSGSINKCFEMLIQREMQDCWQACVDRLAAGELTEAEVLDMGWRQAMTLVKQLGGNSAYLTFSASGVPVDTASGQIAAGMCIDFYGRSQAEWEASHVGRRTMEFVMPAGATTVSADPIGIFRGAPNRERAEMFVDFILSPEGQKLWIFRAGAPGGPIKYELHRLPVRRDFYTPENRRHMTAPEADPFAQAGSFTYQGAWTAPLFDLMRTLIRVMIIDCDEEVRDAWRAILANNQQGEDTPAMAEFARLPFEHHQSGEISRELWTTEGQARLTREWLLFFREHYAEAARLAREAGGRRE